MGKSLMECKNSDEVAELKRDNFTYRDFYVLCDGHNVWLGEQTIDESPTQRVQIPKPIFDHLIYRYITAQK